MQYTEDSDRSIQSLHNDSLQSSVITNWPYHACSLVFQRPLPNKLHATDETQIKQLVFYFSVHCKTGEQP